MNNLNVKGELDFGVELLELLNSNEAARSEVLSMWIQFKNKFCVTQIETAKRILSYNNDVLSLYMLESMR